MTAQVIWSAYLILVFLLISDMLGLLDVWLKATRKIWNYFYGRIWGRILMASLAYAAAFGLIFWWAGGKIDFFNDKTLLIKTWEDRRSFSLGVSGFLLAWLAIIGAVLSAARTEAMEEANKATVEANQETKTKRLHERYENALKTIDGNGLSAIGAIETIKAVALQDQSLLPQTISILCSYLNRNACIDEIETMTCSNHDNLFLHFQHALIALAELQRQRSGTEEQSFNNSIGLILLDLRRIRITDQSEISGIFFSSCNFKNASLSRNRFIGTHFNNCKMTDANFTNVGFNEAIIPFKESFLNDSEFEGTLISNVDFMRIERLGHRQMAKVRYECQHPPKNFPYRLTDAGAAGQKGSRALRPILPPPWDSNMEQYWDMARWERYKASKDAVVPLDQQGNEVPIVDPSIPDKIANPSNDGY